MKRKLLSIPLDSETYEKLRKISFETHTPMAKIAREAIEAAISNYVESHIPANNPAPGSSPESKPSFDDISF